MKVEDAVKGILKEIGEDPDKGKGSRNTPDRVKRLYK